MKSTTGPRSHDTVTLKTRSLSTQIYLSLFVSFILYHRYVNTHVRNINSTGYCAWRHQCSTNESWLILEISVTRRGRPLPSVALLNPWHCRTAIRGTAKWGTAEPVALLNCHPWYCQMWHCQFPALPNCHPWYCQISHCQSRGNAKNFGAAKLPTVALTKLWHCQKFRHYWNTTDDTAKSVEFPTTSALPNPLQCQ